MVPFQKSIWLGVQSEGLTPKHVSEKSKGGYDGNTKVRELVYLVINAPFSYWGDPQGVYL
jgi:hypothetical protein